MHGLRDHGEEVGLEAEDVVEADLGRQAQAAAEGWERGAGEIWMSAGEEGRARGARGGLVGGDGRPSTLRDSRVRKVRHDLWIGFQRQPFLPHVERR